MYRYSLFVLMFWQLSQKSSILFFNSLIILPTVCINNTTIIQITTLQQLNSHSTIDLYTDYKLTAKLPTIYTFQH